MTTEADVSKANLKQGLASWLHQKGMHPGAVRVRLQLCDWQWVTKEWLNAPPGLLKLKNDRVDNLYQAIESYLASEPDQPDPDQVKSILRWDTRDPVSASWLPDFLYQRMVGVRAGIPVELARMARHGYVFTEKQDITVLESYLNLRSYLTWAHKDAKKLVTRFVEWYCVAYCATPDQAFAALAPYFPNKLREDPIREAMFKAIESPAAPDPLILAHQAICNAEPHWLDQPITPVALETQTVERIKDLDKCLNTPLDLTAARVKAHDHLKQKGWIKPNGTLVDSLSKLRAAYNYYLTSPPHGMTDSEPWHTTQVLASIPVDPPAYNKQDIPEWGDWVEGVRSEFTRMSEQGYCLSKAPQIPSVKTFASYLWLQRHLLEHHHDVTPKIATFVEWWCRTYKTQPNHAYAALAPCLPEPQRLSQNLDLLHAAMHQAIQRPDPDNRWIQTHQKIMATYTSAQVRSTVPETTMPDPTPEPETDPVQNWLRSTYADAPDKALSWFNQDNPTNDGPSGWTYRSPCEVKNPVDALIRHELENWTHHNPGNQSLGANTQIAKFWAGVRWHPDSSSLAFRVCRELGAFFTPFQNGVDQDSEIRHLCKFLVLKSVLTWRTFPSARILTSILQTECLKHPGQKVSVTIDDTLAVLAACLKTGPLDIPTPKDLVQAYLYALDNVEEWAFARHSRLTPRYLNFKNPRVQHDTLSSRDAHSEYPSIQRVLRLWGSIPLDDEPNNVDTRVLEVTRQSEYFKDFTHRICSNLRQWKSNLLGGLSSERGQALVRYVIYRNLDHWPEGSLRDEMLRILNTVIRHYKGNTRIDDVMDQVFWKMASHPTLPETKEYLLQLWNQNVDVPFNENFMAHVAQTQGNVLHRLQTQEKATAKPEVPLEDRPLDWALLLNPGQAADKIRGLYRDDIVDQSHWDAVLEGTNFAIMSGQRPAEFWLVGNGLETPGYDERVRAYLRRAPLVSGKPTFRDRVLFENRYDKTPESYDTLRECILRTLDIGFQTTTDVKLVWGRVAAFLQDKYPSGFKVSAELEPLIRYVNLQLFLRWPNYNAGKVWNTILETCAQDPWALRTELATGLYLLKNESDLIRSYSKAIDRIRMGYPAGKDEFIRSYQEWEEDLWAQHITPPAPSGFFSACVSGPPPSVYKEPMTTNNSVAATSASTDPSRWTEVKDQISSEAVSAAWIVGAKQGVKLVIEPTVKALISRKIVSPASAKTLRAFLTSDVGLGVVALVAGTVLSAPSVIKGAGAMIQGKETKLAKLASTLRTVGMIELGGFVGDAILEPARDFLGTLLEALPDEDEDPKALSGQTGAQQKWAQTSEEKVTRVDFGT